ncbi:MAG: transketolase [Halobacteriovoraceae bacterium]|nr:transketolase [Halobacteriovoraceae bacterium]|tara:strand:+ start:3271 stop:5229 length:1959 start_codon:yes stop_codon:yes gene_type:complete
MKPLNTMQSLFNAPSSKPHYSISVTASDDSEVLCGDPNYTRALVALMDLSAVNGGAASHWGGPAAMAECMSALHAYMFQKSDWYNHYNFINDIGHAENGIYALRANLGYGDLDLTALKGFRSIESKLTGHGESHLYPEGVLLSNGPLSSALPQAQGLAHGDKLAGNDRVTIVSMSDGACMEGEAKESFSAIPGLVAKNKLNPFVLIVSDNDTKLSGRITDDAFSMQPSLEAMGALGWSIVKVENGHDIHACYSAIESAIDLARQNKPVFMWVKTIKGYGVKSTMESASGGHGFPVKAYSEDIHAFISEIMQGEVPSELKSWADDLTNKPESKPSADSMPKEKAQAGLARGAIKARKEGLPVVSVSSDLAGSTGMAAFQKEFPSDSLDVGIAEANMVSHGAGLAKAGFIPIVDTFSAFGVTKGNLPLIMASLSSCPLIAVFSHTGFQDAADGASHQSLTYLSAVSSIPNLKAVIISCSEEAEAYMYEAIKDIASKREKGEKASSYIFFVGRENFPKSLGVENYSMKKAQVLKEGSDGVIVSSGPTLYKALKASEMLKEKGKDIAVINSSLVNYPDTETIKKYLNGKLVTVEDHQIIGGLGSQLIMALKQQGMEFNYRGLGVCGHFGQSAYIADELYTKAGLDENAIVDAYLQL